METLKEKQYKNLLLEDYKLIMTFSKRFSDLFLRFPEELSPLFKELSNLPEGKEYTEKFYRNYESIVEESISIMNYLGSELGDLKQKHGEINEEEINYFHENIQQ